MSTPLRVRLFGAFDAQVRGQPLPRLRTRRGQWLLALLVLRHDREVERAWLAGTLWPDSAERDALRSLRQTLADLRRALGEEAGRLQSPGAHTLRLDLAGADVDVVDFDASVARGDSRSLEAAVALYSGPLLEGWTEEWVLEPRQAREQACVRALEQLAEQSLRAGDPSAAADALGRATLADPLRESAHRALMEALAASGAYAAAAEVYRDLRVLLHRELNAAPAPETTALYEAIRGEARRKAEGVRQPASRVRSPDPETSPRSTPGAAGLPQPLTPLLGREREVAEIESWLASARLVTLTGAGGVGKTRLAVQVARELVGDTLEAGPAFAGAAFVDLAPLSDPALVPRAVAAALGAPEQPGHSLEDTLLVVLRPLQMLLVLDNCEHLIDACARLAATLLGGCPELRILATSRQPLGLTGEVAWRVPSLSLPDGDESHPPQTLAQYAGVRLFVERARAAQPGFTLGPENAAAVAAVCRRLDGIPLAIELAAAWVRALPVEQIHPRLADGFRLLMAGSESPLSGSRLPRQQTLRTAIEWSYDLLTPDERALLDCLSVFAGGWTLEAAEAVCGGMEDSMGVWVYGCMGVERSDTHTPTHPHTHTPDSTPTHPHTHTPTQQDEVLRLLTALIDKSLVLRDEDLQSNAGAGRREARYRMQETVRQFARERLESAGVAARYRARHREFFLLLAEGAERERYGLDRRAWLDRLESEHDNLRAALQSSLPGAAGAELSADHSALRLGAALWWFWSVRGHWTEGRAWLEGALAADPAAPAPHRAPALLRAGMLAYRLADYAAAGERYAASLDAHREVGDFTGIARTLYRLGELAEARGEYDQARASVEASLEAARRSGSARTVAESLAGLGTLAGARGDDAAAMSFYRESLALLRGLGGRSENIAFLLKMGALLQKTGDPAAARPLQEEALALSRELGDLGGVAFSLNCLGLSRLAEGDPAAATELLREALSIGRQLGDERGVALSLHHSGLAARARGDGAAAERLLRQALAKRWALGDLRGAGASLRALGHAAQAAGKHGRAVRLWAAGSVLEDALGAPRDPSERAELERAMAAARRHLGEEGCAKEWNSGGALGWENAIAFALREPER